MDDYGDPQGRWVGLAVGAIAIGAAQSRGRPLDGTLRTTVSQRDEKSLRRVRAIIDLYLDERSNLWLGALRALLEGIALRRGDTLPPRLRTFSPTFRNRPDEGDQPASEETLA